VDLLFDRLERGLDEAVAAAQGRVAA
jgi:hypothetical protein